MAQGTNFEVDYEKKGSESAWTIERGSSVGLYSLVMMWLVVIGF
jgi:hypothetical protein